MNLYFVQQMYITGFLANKQFDSSLKETYILKRSILFYNQLFLVIGQTIQNKIHLNNISMLCMLYDLLFIHPSFFMVKLGA